MGDFLEIDFWPCFFFILIMVQKGLNGILCKFLLVHNKSENQFSKNPLEHETLPTYNHKRKTKIEILVSNLGYFPIRSNKLVAGTTGWACWH